MFETHIKAISFSSSQPEGQEEQLLEVSFVSQRHHSAWFYISQLYHPTRSGNAAKGEILIDDIEKLKSFLSVEFDNSHTYRIALVIPPQMSGADDWTMAPLIEMNEIISGSSTGVSNYIYRVDGDIDLYYSKEPDGAWELGSSKLIYKRQSARVGAGL